MSEVNFLSIKSTGVPLSSPMTLAMMFPLSDVRDDKRLCGEELALSAAFSFFETARVIREASTSQVKKGLESGDSSGMGFYNESTFALAYLCRHSVELLLKAALFHTGHDSIEKAHGLSDFYDEVVAGVTIPEGIADAAKSFVCELDSVDKGGTKFRYNFEKDGTPIDIEAYRVNLDALVHDVKMLFVVMCQYVLNRPCPFAFSEN